MKFRVDAIAARGRWLTMMIVVATLLAAMMPGSTAEAQQGNTSVEVIEAAGRAGDMTTVGLDAAGLPVVAYRHDQGDTDELRIARCQDLDCTQSVSGGFEVDIRTFPAHGALALDEDARLVAAYFSGPEQGIVVSRCLDDLCSDRTSNLIVGSTRAERGVSVALDSQSRPVIAYSSSLDQGALQLVRCADPACSSSTSERITRGSSSPQLALDSNDVAVVSYFQNIGQVTKVIRCEDELTCQSPSVANLGNGFPSSMVLAVDSQHPIVMVGDNSTKQIQIALCADPSCDSVDLRNFVRGVGQSDVAFDDVGRPVVAFRGGDDALRVARCSDLNCSSRTNELVDAVDTPRDISITLDPAGNPIIASRAARVFDVRLAHCDNPSCVTTNRNYDFPDSGQYLIRSVATDRYLDADGDGTIGTSRTPNLDDRWLVTERDRRSGVAILTLANAEFASELDDDVWQFETNGDGTFYITRLPEFHRDEAYLSTSGRDVVEDPRHLADRWILEPVQVDVVGQRIALQNFVTDGWLDADPTGEVNQSSRQSADDIWVVEDVGDGTVHLINEQTGGYLDGDPWFGVETSENPSRDDRWIIDQADGFFRLKNAEFGGYLAATLPETTRDVQWVEDKTDESRWRVEILPSVG